jgi:hypothetical protein
MKEDSYLQPSEILDSPLIDTARASRDTFETRVVGAILGDRQPDFIDIVLFLLPLLSIFLWSTSLQIIPLNAMNDLGLISALPHGIISALAMLVVSFVVSLQRRQMRVSLLVIQLICMTLILYGTPILIEDSHLGAAGGTLFVHADYTDYIMRTGTVNPWRDFYFNWPGFFILSAFFTSVAGYSTILSYAAWARVAFNLLYLVPMYIIFTLITTNKRLVWLSLLFFLLTNWVGQDYYSPQGLNFFFYLVIVAILLKWFRMPAQHLWQPGKGASLSQKFFAWLRAPDPPSPSLSFWQRQGLLCCIILIYGLMVCSHPLTAFFMLISVLVLVVFRRCYPFWLPILMTAMYLAWIFFMAWPYLSMHVNTVFATLGQVSANVPSNLANGQFTGDVLYQIIGKMRLVMTVLLWFLAFVGGIKRMRQGNHDITYILLTIVAFPLMAAPQYGREMLQRIYLFTEPFMVFFAASLFFDNLIVVTRKRVHRRATFPLQTAALLMLSLVLLGAFFFTRYGDERTTYITSDEWDAGQYLHQIAPVNSFILIPWGEAPFDFVYYEKDDFESLSQLWPDAVINANPDEVIEVMENKKNPNSYLFFSVEEQLQATVWEGLPGLSGNVLQQLEAKLLKTGRFRLVYHNADAQILQFTG